MRYKKKIRNLEINVTEIEFNKNNFMIDFRTKNAFNKITFQKNKNQNMSIRLGVTIPQIDQTDLIWVFFFNFNSYCFPFVNFSL